ncbi:hypothetical protein EON67_02565 [archaeon]|nr:MAG: hypothetical protein EON67_02565 [archaeon]
MPPCLLVYAALPPLFAGEHETAWRNNALVAYMQDAGVFPTSVVPAAALDFYLQCCSIEVNTRTAATIASTLAAGGVCPLSGERVISASTTKSTLTLMFSCGMYDYSGTWMSHVGLPAKSGVAGLIYVVIPHRMGIAVFAPPLDSHGNSVRGVAFCKALLRAFPFGIFNQLVSAPNVTRALRPPPPGSATASSVSQRAAAGSFMLSTKSAARSVDHITPPPHETDARTQCVAGGVGNATPPRVSRDVLCISTSAPFPAGGAGMPRRRAMFAAASLEVARRCGVRLRRLHRLFRMLRTWCGLPCTPHDLAALQAFAAVVVDGDAGVNKARDGVEGSAAQYADAHMPSDAARLLFHGHTPPSVRGLSITARQRRDGTHESELVEWGRTLWFHYERYCFDVDMPPLQLSAVCASDGADSSGAAPFDVTLTSMPLPVLMRFLATRGLLPPQEFPHLHRLLCTIVDSPVLEDTAIVTLPLLFAPASDNNLVVRAALGCLAMSNFSAFIADVESVMEIVRLLHSNPHPCARHRALVRICKHALLLLP